MNRTRLTLVALLGLSTLAGCASNRIVGNKIVRSSRWYGELGITGHLNEITIETGSNLTKLSVIGNYNNVHVLDGVPLGKIEIWGQQNKVYIPMGLTIRDNIVGHGSEIIRTTPGEQAPAPAPEFVPEPAPEEAVREAPVEETTPPGEPNAPE
jgi:hypothetical protein